MISGSVKKLFEDSKGNLWFSGKHIGVYCYDGKQLIHFLTDDKNNKLNIMDITEDKQNRIWLGGLNGLFRIDNDSVVPILKMDHGNSS